MTGNRFLSDDDPPAPLWQAIYVVIVLFIMFAVLITDRVGTSSVMLTALTAVYMAEIITVKEAIAGFSSQGLLTVLVLFVVAEGLNKTGALSWYVGRMLGRPKTLAGAQLRVMIPITMLSGFINDTPLVVVTLPIIIQWARKVNVSTRFLLIPLSFAALLGGVITLIGTSTNLVVVGLLQDYYPDDPEFQDLPLLALGQYGLPVAIVGVAYVVAATPYLLARGHWKEQTTFQDSPIDDILLGARLTQWSPAAGRSVRRSGLRDTGGIYLVRVKRAATGNVHHAVGPEFILEVGDILYFTGLVESFGEFCHDHGLEVITNEVEITSSSVQSSKDGKNGEMKHLIPQSLEEPLANDIGITLDSVLQASSQERMKVIYRIEDAIRGESNGWSSDQNRVVVTKNDDLVVVAIDTSDRSELLLDISKTLARLHLELHHTEAAARDGRSLSIWRCELPNKSDNDDPIAEIWSVLHALLANDTGIQAIKQRGKRVVRAKVLKGRLDGASASSMEFREIYKAAIVAIQKGGKSLTESLATIRLDRGDILVLQTNDDSPLLLSPPEDFYAKLASEGNDNGHRSSITSKLFGQSPKSPDRPGRDIESVEKGSEATEETEAVWRDLQVLVAAEDSEAGPGVKEFLAAMEIKSGSKLQGQTVTQAGIDKLPGLVLVSIERPVAISEAGTGASSFAAIAMSEPLMGGDILWFAGSPSAVGDIRKVPGLVSYQREEVSKMNERIFDRRLVEAVVARQSPLVGKTVKEVRFRTQYGAAVIAVQREGRRVHDHPGNVKLLSGDVLLLEAGPSFMSNKIQNDGSFSLVAAVENSAPPRLRMLIPALALTAAAYICYAVKLSTLIGCAMCAAILMVALGVLSETEARDAIMWDIYLTIAAAFGLGTALVNSGVASAVAKFLVRVGNALGMGTAGLLGAVYLSTVLISQIVANNAAAALIFPIAMEAAESTGTDLKLMAFTIMLAASAAFMTPFGYQTNLMVMAIRSTGYTTLDYLIFGTPMQLVLLVTTTIALVTPFWICFLASFSLLLSVSAIRLNSDLRKNKRKKM